VDVCTHKEISFFTNRFNLGNTHEVVREYVQDPQLIQQLADFQKQNAELLAQFQELSLRIDSQQIESFEDLQKFDKKGADALINLASKTQAMPMDGRNFGFFGLTSTGKSTIINKLLNKEVAEVGAGETTMKIQPYEGQGYRLFDIPGRNDDMSYFSMEYISFWKGLTARLVVITVTIKEMTKVFRLLDAINLNYDIIVNKFDTVPLEERDKFKAKIQDEVTKGDLKGVNNIWYVSAENPRQFPDWINMIDYLTKIN
jgi:GTP-binding protein EngB required for normal cell division